MTTAFPGALDSFVNPQATDTQDAVPHADQHANINDGMAAVQAKVGVTSSTDHNSHDFKLSLVTGSGTAVSSDNFSGTSYGTNTGDQNLFSTIVVSGQPSIVATGTSSSLTLFVSGATLTTNTGNGSILLSVSTSTGGGSGEIAITGVVTGSGSSPVSLTYVSTTGTGASVLQVAPTITGAILVGATVISGGTISGATFGAGTISGSTIGAATILASTFSGSTMVASTFSGTIGGSTVSGSTLVGCTISGATIVGTTVSGGTIIGTTITGATIVASTIGRRPVTLSNASGITVNLANGNLFTLTGLTTACLFSFTGTASVLTGYVFEMRVYSTGSQAVSFDSTARASADQSLPSATYGNSKWERWLWEWHEIDSKLDILTVNRGH